MDSSPGRTPWTEADTRYRAPDVVLIPYDETWPQRYQTEVAILKQLFGEGLRAIEHVGSTSIYGMSAKPTIDIVADIAFPGEFEGLVEQLSSIEYLFAPNPVCAVFGKGPADMVLPRGVHLHVRTEGSDYWRRIVGSNEQGGSSRNPAATPRESVRL